MGKIWWDCNPAGDYNQLVEPYDNGDIDEFKRILDEIEQVERALVRDRIDIMREDATSWPEEQKKWVADMIKRLMDFPEYQYSREKAIQRAYCEVKPYVEGHGFTPETVIQRIHTWYRIKVMDKK